MANYHLLQSKERTHEGEEEEATGNRTPSPAGTESDKSKLWKYILAVCVITVTSFIAGCRFSSQLFLNGAPFTEDLSFLSSYITRETIICVKS